MHTATPNASAFASPKKSTNVRAKIGLDGAKWLFGALDQVAPSAASWLAARLFMTPPRFPAPAAERAALSEARRFHVPTPRGRLTAWFWAGGGPTVLLVHGWGGRAGQLGSIALHLQQQGFSVVAFDAPAHGESPGRRTNLVHFADAIAAVVAAYGPMAGTVAHSMGGAAAAIALGRGVPLGRTVLIGSPSELQAQSHRFAGMLGLGESLRAAMQSRIERRVGVPFQALDLAARPRPSSPVLIAHDRLDGEVPFEEGRRLAEAWGAELIATDGLGHRRILRDPEVLSRVIGFLSQDLARTFVPKACATPGCPHPAATGDEVWTGWEAYCPSCALELDLRTRPSRPSAA